MKNDTITGLSVWVWGHDFLYKFSTQCKLRFRHLNLKWKILLNDWLALLDYFVPH